MCVLMLYLGGVYSFAFGALLAPIGRLDLLVLLMAVMAVALCFFFGIMGSAGFVFGGKDNDLLLALPGAGHDGAALQGAGAVSGKSCLYPVFAAAGNRSLSVLRRPRGAVSPLSAGRGSCCCRCCPAALCLLVGFVFSLIQSRVLPPRADNNLLYLGFFAAIMVLSMKMSFTMSSEDSSAAAAIGPALSWALPAVWLSRALCTPSLAALGSLRRGLRAPLCAGHSAVRPVL